jgi:FMN phosphatase YigB (HAD superfamily)
MITAIVFDCFGVLATDGWLPFRRQYFGTEGDLFERAATVNKQVDAGLISFDDFIAVVAGLADMTPERARHLIVNNVPDEALLGYIAGQLKPDYKIGMLSNVAGNWLGDMFTEAQVALFDAVALSYETSFVKPDPRAYQTICDRLGVPPEECVFLDDQERYCTAARDGGMQAIVYQNFAQAKAELEQLLAS